MPERRHEPHGEVRGDDRQVAVRQVDDPHRAEQQRQAAGEQRVEPAEQDPLDDAFDPVHAATRPRPRRPKYAASICSGVNSDGRPSQRGASLQQALDARGDPHRLAHVLLHQQDRHARLAAARAGARRSAGRPRGASPSESSSSSSTRGLATSARPIATACCSPPESCAARWRRRSGIHRNSSYTRSTRPRARPRVVRADQQVLLERERREEPAALRHQRDPGGEPPLGRQAGRCPRPRAGPSRARRGAGRRCVRSSVDLPAPFAPMIACTSPAPTRRLTSASARSWPWSTVRPRDLEQRPAPRASAAATSLTAPRVGLGDARLGSDSAVGLGAQEHLPDRRAREHRGRRRRRRRSCRRPGRSGGRRSRSSARTTCSIQIDGHALRPGRGARSRPARPTSGSVSPPATSSSRSSRGRVASARASSSRLRWSSPSSPASRFASVQQARVARALGRDAS